MQYITYDAKTTMAELLVIEADANGRLSIAISEVNLRHRTGETVGRGIHKTSRNAYMSIALG